MNFYVCVIDEHTLVAFCFNSPSVFQEILINGINAVEESKLRHDPMAGLQCFILAGALKLYDTSIWTLRDYIRDIETVGPVLLVRAPIKLAG